MSVLATIGILLTKKMGVVDFCEKVILENFRLVNRENEEFYYAALGSEYIEEYERVLSASELMHVVEQKKAANEDVVFSFYVQDEVSAVFNWYFEKNTAGFTLTGNRVCLADTRWTDFSWYLEILLRAIGPGKIISIECVDYH